MGYKSSYTFPETSDLGTSHFWKFVTYNAHGKFLGCNSEGVYIVCIKTND